MNPNNKLATRKRRLALTAAGLCNVCGQTKAEPGKKKCTKCLAYFVEYNRKNASKYEPRKKDYRQKIKKEVIEKYGGECKCCGEKTFEFLAIDHINNDGGIERRKRTGANKSTSYSWYLQLRRDPKRADLQVLCHNCNCAKAFYGICPHQKSK